MSGLLLVRAPGLTVEQACRGDMAANLSDLIADGSFAAVSGASDLPAVVRSLGPERVTLVEVPFKDMTSFDAELTRLREGAAGRPMAVVSDAVFISQRFFPELKPGTVLSPADVSRLLSAMAQEE